MKCKTNRHTPNFEQHFEHELFGKPYEPRIAKHMLKTLSGEQHKVVTGVNILLCGNSAYANDTGTKPDRRRWRERYFETKTVVKLKHLDEKLIEEYIELEESL